MLSTSASPRIVTRLRTLGAVLTVSAFALAGCSGGSSEGSKGSDAGTEDVKQTITIFAAASLQGPLDDVAKAFTTAHPEYDIAPIDYDGSQALATQAIDGADVDVLAFASEASLDPLTKAGITDSSEIFATNTLEIAVAPGNPKKITSFDDLTATGTSLVTCASEVPCGQATDTVEKATGTTLKPVSEETNVTSVVNRVSQGEADAGLVYTTDIKAAGDKLEGVEFPESKQAVNKYPVAVPTKAKHAEGGKVFEKFLLSDDGQKVLHDAGFGAP
ncbi:molybdate ABC transporter substrate-binding protein [Brachybacterium endophyticum]|uniref:Molybdate ABC transporter substrate-binding protein n=1 Tax=Brachybacterium endophyticum TaxID=2182385 RepID=A0A2U2RHY3_9MICO|nr:molybdate ABC transporter substrate-binding protein [Brachybacterium endophyticum]PWH05483.1 molybdate ABC transporter substrate-binding protein [Brachybacterium endophyticum]